MQMNNKQVVFITNHYARIIWIWGNTRVSTFIAVRKMITEGIGDKTK